MLNNLNKILCDDSRGFKIVNSECSSIETNIIWGGQYNFSFIMGTLHRRNDYSTVQTIFYPLTLNLPKRKLSAILDFQNN